MEILFDTQGLGTSHGLILKLNSLPRPLSGPLSGLLPGTPSQTLSGPFSSSPFGPSVDPSMDPKPLNSDCKCSNE